MSFEATQGRIWHLPLRKAWCWKRMSSRRDVYFSALAASYVWGRHRCQRSALHSLPVDFLSNVLLCGLLGFLAEQLSPLIGNNHFQALTEETLTSSWQSDFRHAQGSLHLAMSLPEGSVPPPKYHLSLGLTSATPGLPPWVHYYTQPLWALHLCDSYDWLYQTLFYLQQIVVITCVFWKDIGL